MFCFSQALSKIVYSIFLPALLFTNIVETLSRPLAPGLTLLPFAAMVQVFIGLLIGLLLCRLLRLNRPERHVFLVCTSFGNSAALPLLFATSLFANSPALPQLVASISFFLLGWTGLFWAVGYTLLATMTPAAATAVALPPPSFKQRLYTFGKRVGTPPLIGSLLGLAVGLVAPVRKLLMASPLFPAMVTLATGYSPAAVLILAGSLARRSGTNNNNNTSESAETPVHLRAPRMVAGIALTRFVLMPLFACLMVRYGPFRSPFVVLALLFESTARAPPHVYSRR